MLRRLCNIYLTSYYYYKIDSVWVSDISSDGSRAQARTITLTYIGSS